MHADRCQAGARVAFWLLLAAVTVLSLLPVQYLPPQAFSLWDKAEHALAFLGLGLLGLLAYPARPLRLALVLLAFGGAIELVQAATGWRQGEWADLLADAVGLGAGLVLGLAMRRWLATRCYRG